MHKCPFCERAYELKSSLSVHISRRHRDMNRTYKCECGREFDNHQSLNAHYRHCLIHRRGEPPAPSGMKGKVSRFRGKTLIDMVRDPEGTRNKLRLARMMQKPHHFTEEQKKKLSENRIRYLEEHSPHVQWYNIAGVKVQGSWERDVALYLAGLGLVFKRVRLIYDGHRRYTPDFYIPSLGLYLEVKGFLRSRDVEKYRKVLAEHRINLRFIWKLKNLKKLLAQVEPDFDSLPDFQQVVKAWEPCKG